jgi:C4-dicarboxylate transporter DctQ subunit
MKLAKLINYGISILCGVLLILMVSITFIQIVCREIFNFSLYWSDQVSQYCMMWMVLFGSIWLTRQDQHINTKLKLHQKLNKRLIGLIDGILALVTVSCVAIVTYQSVIFVSQQWVMESISLPWLKMGYVYIALPFAMLELCIFYLKSFFKNLAHIFKKN